MLKKTEDLLKSEKTNPGRYLRVLDIDIDTESGTVWRDGAVIDLPELSFRLLWTLARNAPELVSKDKLIADVWGDVVVSDETLMQRVRLLRQALGEESQNPRYIASVRGRGYRLAAPVEVITEANLTAKVHAPRRWKIIAATGAAAIAIVVLAMGVLNRETGPPAISTLAVLPFSDLSEDQRFGYFADGMQEELLARLAGLSEVSVISRASVERFRDATNSIPDISEALNATGIIEGSIRVSGNRLRITVQLIDGETDQHLWAESYEEELTVENVFAIQARVADAIAEALRVEYGRQETMALGLPTTDIDAYNFYLLGRYQTFRPTPENLDLAVQYLLQAVDLDNNFAKAYAALGWAYMFQGSEYGGSDPNSVVPLAREAALRALEIDDRLADAHALYADILTWYDWEFELAESEYRRAISLDPLNVLGYALFLSTQGRHDEAISMVERQLEALPDDSYVRTNAGWRYLHAGRYSDAVDAALRSQGHPDARSLLGFGYMGDGDIDRAVAAFEEDMRRQGRGQTQIANLAYAYFKAGDRATAKPLLEELEGRSDTVFVSPTLRAAIYFASGNEERGYELLGQAVDARERNVIFLNVSVSFIEQRDDPRFIAIARRVGLPASDSSL